MATKRSREGFKYSHKLFTGKSYLSNTLGNSHADEWRDTVSDYNAENTRENMEKAVLPAFMRTVREPKEVRKKKVEDEILRQGNLPCNCPLSLVSPHRRWKCSIGNAGSGIKGNGVKDDNPQSKEYNPKTKRYEWPDEPKLDDPRYKMVKSWNPQYGKYVWTQFSVGEPTGSTYNPGSDSIVHEVLSNTFGNKHRDEMATLRDDLNRKTDEQPELANYRQKEMNKQGDLPCQCPTSAYFPHRRKKCVFQNVGSGLVRPSKRLKVYERTH